MSIEASYLPRNFGEALLGLQHWMKEQGCYHAPSHEIIIC